MPSWNLFVKGREGKAMTVGLGREPEGRLGIRTGCGAGGCGCSLYSYVLLVINHHTNTTAIILFVRRN